MSAKPIAVLQGASTAVIQALISDFVERARAAAAIVGVVEDHTAVGSSRAGLRSIKSGARYSLFQDLGPEAASCGLDAGGVVEACEAVRQDIEAGCDLVVLNKFAQLEADRSGLASAFSAAIEVGAPILTAVSPKFAEAWERFAAPLYVVLPPEAQAIERWWREVRTEQAAGSDVAASPA